MRPFAPRSPHALAAALLASLCACGDDRAAAPAAERADRYAPAIVATVPSGDPVQVRLGLAPGDVLRSKGTWTYRQTATGRFGPEGRKPSRSIEGAVDVERRLSSGSAGTLHSTVSGRLDLTERDEGAAPRPRVVPFTLGFDEDPAGGAVHRTIRLEAAPDLAADLATLSSAFTDRFALPKGAARVGEGFAPATVMFLDDVLRRPLWFLFQARAAAGDSVGAPILGRVWVEAHETYGGDDALRMRVAVTHAYGGDLDPKAPPKDAVHVTWTAAIEGVCRLATDGGWMRTQDLATRRRVRFVSREYDYEVDVEGRVAIETTRERR